LNHDSVREASDFFNSLLDEHGGQRELGDLVDAIADFDMPLLLIEAMIDEELIQFVPGYPFDAAAPVMRIV